MAEKKKEGKLQDVSAVDFLKPQLKNQHVRIITKMFIVCFQHRRYKDNHRKVFFLEKK